jgi:hypothetical protein
MIAMINDQSIAFNFVIYEAMGELDLTQLSDETEIVLSMSKWQLILEIHWPEQFPFAQRGSVLQQALQEYDIVFVLIRNFASLYHANKLYIVL